MSLLSKRTTCEMLWDDGFWVLTSVFEFVGTLRRSSAIASSIPPLLTLLAAFRMMHPLLFTHKTERCPHKEKAAVNYLWRQQPTEHYAESRSNLLCCDGNCYAPRQGLTMSRVLIPFLLRSMTMHNLSDDTTFEIITETDKDCQWKSYANTATIVLFFCLWRAKKTPNCFSLQTFFLIAAIMTVAFLAISPLYFNILPWSRLERWLRLAVFVTSWMFSFHALVHVSPLHSVFTQGEWTVVTCGIAILLAETVVGATNQSSISSSWSPLLPHHQRVAMMGCLGSGIAIVLLFCITNCWWANSQVKRNTGSIHYKSTQILLVRLVFLVGLPLIIVEWTVRHSLQVESRNHYFPHCLLWLWQFLSDTEINPYWTSSNPWHSLFSFPRYVWLVYWLVNLTAATVLLYAFLDTGSATSTKANSSGNTLLTTVMAQVSRRYYSSTVVVRKLFHGLAVLLFTPVAICAPQLLSLSYAIATVLLMTMEYIRSDLPMVHNFYQKYLDPNKDNSAKVVISHTALILGCAIPHWIADACCCYHGEVTIGEKYQTQNVLLLLRLWGVISLGIGDALGAIVGTWYGRTLWGGPSPRTVEGSTAMCFGMTLACYSLVGADVLTEVWLPVVVLTTILELATLQIDNIVLPLAGTAWILFLVSLGSAP